MTYRVSAKPWFIYRNMHYVWPILTFKTSVKRWGDQLESLLSIYVQSECLVINSITAYSHDYFSDPGLKLKAIWRPWSKAWNITTKRIRKRSTAMEQSVKQLCLSLLYCLFCSLKPCNNLLGKGWPLGSLLCCVSSCFCHFPKWCPWSSAVLDCIDSWSLPCSLFSPAYSEDYIWPSSDDSEDNEYSCTPDKDIRDFTLG